MILELILGAIISLLTGMIGLVPDIVMAGDDFDISGIISLISKVFIIFPADLFAVCILHITFWMVAHMTWAIFEWVYKKIPGVS